MSADIYVAVNGQPTDLDEVTWYVVAPCGCTSGATTAYSDYGPPPARVIATAEQALVEFYDSKAEREKYERLGFTVECGLRSEITERMPTDGCPHTPRYGYDIPQPDGMVWAVGGYHGSRTTVRHLVAEDVAADSDGRQGYTPATALCGQSQHHWSTEWHVTDGKVECSRCTKRATS